MHDVIGFALPYETWRRCDGDRWQKHAAGCFDAGITGPIELWLNHARDGRGVWDCRAPLAETRDGSLEVFANRAGVFFRASVRGAAGALVRRSVWHMPLRVSIGGHVDEEHAVGPHSIVRRGRIGEISILVGWSPRYASTWTRPATPYGEELIAHMDLDARMKEIDALRATA